MKNIVLILISLLCIGCSSSKNISKRTHKKLRGLITASPVFEKSFTGFSLFNPTSNKTLVSVNGDKHFTPASNIKILSLYTALKILGDSLPAFQYFETKDSLFILGTGDPTFLHSSFNNNALLNFLQESEKQQFLLSPFFNEKKWGPGWAWDDYNDYYQVEKAALPIYGNVVTFTSDSTNLAFPNHFKNSLLITKNDRQTHSIKRALFKNSFVVNHNFALSKRRKEVPFIYSDTLIINLLNKYPGINITAITATSISKKQLKTVYSTPKDTVLTRMMHISDNFIAEQLLLMSSYKRYGAFNSNKIIRYTKDTLLSNSPHPLVWKDGSGLSRYNLITPHSLVFVLAEINKITNRRQLLDLFPDGSSKSLRNSYKSLGNSIHAKTGTLSNKHCLSGYLICSSGQLLIFSFMHNNYVGSSAPIKKEMAQILSYIITNY